jgi:hypothetical protein
MPAPRSTKNRFIPVESEMLVAVRYDDKTQQFDAIFRTGDKYRYKRVPRFEYDGLMSAESKGQYMHKRILGRYDYERID